MIADCLWFVAGSEVVWLFAYYTALGRLLHHLAVM